MLLAEFRSKYWKLIKTDSRIRNRVLTTLILLSLIIFLIYFSIQQGVSNWENTSSGLGIFVAINVNIILLAVVFYQILKNILKLAYERHHHVIGIKLKTKLIFAFLLLSFPATTFHLFASSFISTTLESWLAGQHDVVIKSAQKVTDAYHRNLKGLMELQGSVLENNILRSPGMLQQTTALDHIVTHELGEGILIYNAERAITFQRLRSKSAKKRWKPLSRAEWEQIEQQKSTWLTEELENRFIYRHIRKMQTENNTIYLEVFFPATKNVTGAISKIAEQQMNTQFFTESENLVKRYYMVIFLLMTLIIIFVATWLAFYLARGFVRPIENLSEATQRVAEGELGYQVDVRSVPLDKDFAVLINSFNKMSLQLLENQQVLEKTTKRLQQSNRTLEEHYRFIELILENIKTGVMALDMEGNVEEFNRSAKQLLQLKTTNYLGKHYQDVLDRKSLEVFEEMFQDIIKGQHKVISKDLTVIKQYSPIHITVTMLIMENRDGQSVGVISVYENITEIQRFQRAQAWREVARRIAHEIKNPLTPIQLSAERIRYKYADQVQDNKTLIQGTQTIIREVEHLKVMVSEFSRFAKMPESSPQPDDLNSIVTEASQIYEEGLPEYISLKIELNDNIPRFPLDREQIKRVLVNLIDNAIAAIEKKLEGYSMFSKGMKKAREVVTTLLEHQKKSQEEILIETHYDKELKIALIKVIDSGTGVAPEILSRLFEPYATTKEHGTGLGLTLVQQIISDHNGFVRHQNIEGSGSCFTIELPVS